MGKKNRKAKDLEDMCLHCAFFQVHGDKWPDWKADGDNVSQEAFNDLVRSAVKIVAEVFTMLDPLGQMRFMNQVMTSYTAMEGDSEGVSLTEIKEIAEIFRRHSGPTKH